MNVATFTIQLVSISLSSLSSSLSWLRTYLTMWPSTNSIVKHLISQHHPHQKHQYHRYYINRLQNRSIRAPLYYLPSKLTSKCTISLLLLSVSRLISSIRIVLHSFPLIFYCSAILLLFLLKTCTGSSAIDHRHQHNVSRNDNDNVNYNSTHHHINRFSNHSFTLNDSPPNGMYQYKSIRLYTCRPIYVSNMIYDSISAFYRWWW